VEAVIDLRGASGVTYRFRRSGWQSPIGGNFVYVRLVDGKPSVVCCGCARSLGRSLIDPIWPLDENAQPGDLLYVRLNAASSTRQSEHEDLVSGLPRPFVIYEND